MPVFAHLWKIYVYVSPFVLVLVYLCCYVNHLLGNTKAQMRGAPSSAVTDSKLVLVCPVAEFLNLAEISHS